MTSASPRRTAVLLLAAGASSRLGRPKQLLEIHGEPLVRAALQTAIDAGVGPVLVVIARGDVAVSEALAGKPHTIVENADPRRGMGSSIKAGISAIRDDHSIDAAIITLCDQPHVTAVVLRDLAHQRGTTPAAACRYAQTLGVPACFGRELFDELMAIDDDAGAKPVLLRHKERIVTIDFPSAAIDIDTGADLARLR